MKTVQISGDALSDLNEGYLFYETQQTGLGDYFASSIRADIESLKISGDVHRVVYQDYHRLLSHTFPYGIFYTAGEEKIVVWAVIDLRRKPEWIREKLSQ